MPGVHHSPTILHVRLLSFCRWVEMSFSAADALPLHGDMRMVEMLDLYPPDTDTVAHEGMDAVSGFESFCLY